MTLFAGYDPPDPPPGLSPGRRLTARQAANVAAGVHPLTRGPIHPSASRDAAPGPRDAPFTCGSCMFRQPASGGHQGTFPKCVLPGPNGHPIPARLSSSATSDVRAWWPACPDYKPT